MFRISLRELFALVACCAFALMTLKYASDAWLTAVLSVVILAIFVAAIFAAVDRGPRQAFSLAFVLIVIGYGWLVFRLPRMPSNPQVTGGSEFGLSRGRLPTTKILRHLYAAVDEERWVDNSTGKELPNFDPANPSIPIASFSGGGMMPGSPTARTQTFPYETDFVPIGHLWWSLLLGYIGGRFGRYVYSLRISRKSE